MSFFIGNSGTFFGNNYHKITIYENWTLYIDFIVWKIFHLILLWPEIKNIWPKIAISSSSSSSSSSSKRLNSFQDKVKENTHVWLMHDKMYNNTWQNVNTNSSYHSNLMFWISGNWWGNFSEFLMAFRMKWFLTGWARLQLELLGWKVVFWRDLACCRDGEQSIWGRSCWRRCKMKVTLYVNGPVVKLPKEYNVISD